MTTTAPHPVPILIEHWELWPFLQGKPMTVALAYHALLACLSCQNQNPWLN